MKWLLVCLGALMIVVGGSCILSGYPIVEVERGWTLVISGTTALSAGVILLGLALVAARIENLSRLLGPSMRPLAQTPVEAPNPVAASPVAASPLAPAFDERQEQEPSPKEDFPETAVPEAAASRPVRVRNWQAPSFLKRTSQPELFGRADLDETAAALAAAPAVREPAAHEEVSPASSPLLAEPVADLAAPEPPLAAGEEGAASAPEIAAPLLAEHAAEPEPLSPQEPSFRRFPLRSLTLPRGPWPDSPLKSTAGEASHPPSEEQGGGLATAPEGKPTPEDWFERALAGLDDGAEPGSRRDAAEHAGKADELLPQAGDSAPHEHREEPVSHDSAPAEVAIEAPAVIGRYETEGTVYVMYADGSIDAETATGVYRFDSLAALKEHIEGPA